MRASLSHLMHIGSTMLSSFIEDVIDRRSGLISPERVSAALRVTLAQLARVAQVHRNTLSRHPARQRYRSGSARSRGSLPRLPIFWRVTLGGPSSGSDISRWRGSMAQPPRSWSPPAMLTPCWPISRCCATVSTPDAASHPAARSVLADAGSKMGPRALSGEGAATRGGRFNPPGMNALYMSGDFVTTIAEYEQDLGIRPGTLCAYEADVAAIVDLRDPATRFAARVEMTDLSCAWKHIALVLHQRPPTWDLATRLVEEGAAEIRVPSVRAADGVNLVLWRWNDAAERRVDVLDPFRDLPRDQQSWSR